MLKPRIIKHRLSCTKTSGSRAESNVKTSSEEGSWRRCCVACAALLLLGTPVNRNDSTAMPGVLCATTREPTSSRTGTACDSGLCTERRMMSLSRRRHFKLTVYSEQAHVLSASTCPCVQIKSAEFVVAPLDAPTHRPDMRRRAAQNTTQGYTEVELYADLRHLTRTDRVLRHCGGALRNAAVSSSCRMLLNSVSSREASTCDTRVADGRWLSVQPASARCSKACSAGVGSRLARGRSIQLVIVPR